MGDETEKAKKMAHEITTANESSDFDLAGYGPDQLDRMAAAAFKSPLPLAEMIRFTFMVGGGKKVRQKYNDNLPMLFTNALKKVGFEEDRGASLALECGGTFKFQHNTDTDLKVVHVYPRVDPDAAAAGDADVEDSLSPEALLTYSELATFKKMVAAKTPGFAQRKVVLDVLKRAKALYSNIEEKLSRMEELTNDEQRRYDELDMEEIEKKQQWLTQQMDTMITTGQLNVNERKIVLEQLTTKMEALELQIATADSEGKEKRVAKLQEMRTGLDSRLSGVRDLKPVTRKLKFEAEMKAARAKLKELAKLENSKAMLSLADAQKLNARPKLLQDLAVMEAESQGWFPNADSLKN